MCHQQQTTHIELKYQKMSFTNKDIICDYFETSISNTSNNMIMHLNRLIDHRRNFFTSSAEEHNLTLNQLLDGLYKRFNQFPFYLDDKQILDYLKERHCNINDLPKSLTNQTIISKYCENSNRNISDNMMVYLNQLINDKRTAFTNIAKQHNLEFDQLLDCLYKKFNQFPFYFDDTQILDCLEKTQHDVNYSPKSLTNQAIISKYFETSMRNISDNMIIYLYQLINNRRTAFTNIAEQHNLKFDQLLDYLYKRFNKFPFYLNDNEILDYLKQRQCNDNNSPKSLTNHAIISKYFETSMRNTSDNMINYLNELITNRRNVFTNIAKQHNLQFDQLLDCLYKRSNKFPFYLNDNEILECLKQRQCDDNDSPKSLTNQAIISKYFETSTRNISDNMIDYLNELIDNRRNVFTNVAKKYNLQFDQLLDCLYNRSNIFPFYLNDNEILNHLNNLQYGTPVGCN